MAPLEGSTEHVRRDEDAGLAKREEPHAHKDCELNLRERCRREERGDPAEEEVGAGEGLHGARG